MGNESILGPDPVTTSRRLRRFLIALVLGAIAILPCAAATHRETFDGEKTSLIPRFDRREVRLLSHRRHTRDLREGTAAENVEFVVGRSGGKVRLEQKLPSARVFEELEVAVWVKSNRNGATLSLRLVFPNHRDPRSDGLLSALLRGDTYKGGGQWQRLVCRTTDRRVKERLRSLRWQLKGTDVNSRGLYVDRVLLDGEFDPGSVSIFVDDLRFGPIVDPKRGDEVELASATAETGRPDPVDFRLDRLHVEGRPFLPRITPFHNESPELLAECGLNTIWVPDYRDGTLLERLREDGLWAMATPPRPTNSDGAALTPDVASLVPLGPETDPVLMWYAGTRVPIDRRDDVSAWSAQIRQADRRRRPLLIDVKGGEREFSRTVRMLGTSRHVLHTGFPLADYRDWLLARRRRAWPGTFSWTWIQTEPSAGHQRWRDGDGRRPLVVEPEQLRLQVYAALSAGCRGLGFWKSTGLDSTLPGAEERRLALRQLNLELSLLEPLLATGTVDRSVEVEVTPPKSVSASRNRVDLRSGIGRRQRNALLRSWANQQRRERLGSERVEAAVVRTSAGTLLLPVWYGDNAQFVPGQHAANDARILVVGASESATAWEITTTGLRTLPRKRVTGGIEITLPKLDQTAAILLTSDRSAVERLRRHVDDIAETSAAVAVELAAAKLKRVKEVQAELGKLRATQPDAPQLLARAELVLQRAGVLQRQGNHDAARETARDVRQLLRILQRADWEEAVGALVSGVAGPHTLCHNTLPDHWRMIAAIGRSTEGGDENLLRSGDFEDVDTMIADGWQHEQKSLPGTRALAELHEDAKRGRYGLRLFAAPTRSAESPKAPAENPVLVRTPAVDVRAGQIVHVSGWFRYIAPGPGLEGPIAFDNLAGAVGGLRLRTLVGEDETGWQRFEFLREVRASGEFRVTFALGGFGELHLDDVRIVALEPRAESLTPATTTPPRNGRLNPLDLLGRIPGLRRRETESR